MVLGAAMTAVITWYRAPMDRLTGHLEHNVYDFEGLALTAYILSAFGFAVLAGLLLLLRRSIPAMVAAFMRLRHRLRAAGHRPHPATQSPASPATQNTDQLVLHATQVAP